MLAQLSQAAAPSRARFAARANRRTARTHTFLLAGARASRFALAQRVRTLAHACDGWMHVRLRALAFARSGSALPGPMSRTAAADESGFPRLDCVLNRCDPSEPAPHSVSNCDGTLFQVRSKTYLQDGEKVQSAPSALKLLGVDLLRSTERADHLAARPDSVVARARAAGWDHFIFAVNVQLPGPPHVACIAYWSETDEKLRADPTLHRLLTELVEGDDDFRDNRLKLIPSVVDGPWLVRKAVGNKPAIVGRKLTQRYFVGENYLEVDLDVGSSAIARRVTGMAMGASKSLTVDMAWVIEGLSESELPERVLAGMRCHELDLARAVPLRP